MNDHDQRAKPRALLLAALALLFACSRPTRRETPEEARRAAKGIFEARCASCHGLNGKGSGPLAAGLNPKPRDYTDRVWQKSTTDEALRTIIVKGGMSVGKSALMPANPDIADQPLVVDALIAIVRGFGGGQGGRDGAPEASVTTASSSSP